MTSIAYLLDLEKNGCLPNITNITNMDNIKTMEKNRTIILTWTFELSRTFKFRWEVWFHSVTIFDRCIEVMDIPNDKFQLYAVVCLCLSAKKYEIITAELADYVYVCNEAITCDDIITVEKEIFDIMNYNVELPNIMTYIRYISSISKPSYKVFILTKILCIYYCVHTITILPTILVTASHMLAYHIVGDNINDTSNPFSIDNNIIDSARSQIKQRICKQNIILKNAICKYLTITKSSIDWDTIVETLSLLTFVSNNEIPKKYTPEHYTNIRKHTDIIEKNKIKNIQKLGDGTFGKVHKIKINDQMYACKKIYNQNDEEGLCQSFIRESSLLQTLSHKNIISIHYIIKNSTCMILDIMDCDLCFYINRHHKIKNQENFQNMCVEELLCGLDHMHSYGVIHRDIKPQNILIKGNWPDITIKYCDFGSARGDHIINSDVCYTTKITTLWYRTPENLLGCTSYGFEIDIWSLMCTLAEIVNGKALFQGYSEIEQACAIFQIMGSPTDDIWEDAKKLPNYKMMYLKWTNKLEQVIPKNSKITNIIHEGLILDPKKRPNVKTLLSSYYNFGSLN